MTSADRDQLIATLKRRIELRQRNHMAIGGLEDRLKVLTINKLRDETREQEVSQP